MHSDINSEKMVKNIVLIILMLTVLVTLKMFYDGQCDEVTTINFANKQWLFPSTVEDAVIKHGLDYRPPGYYFKIFQPDSMEVMLYYNCKNSDFYTENQPKESLYERKLNSYIFGFYEKKGMYDSLKTILENTYNKKFMRTKRIQNPKYPNTPKLEFDLMKINSCLSVAMKTNKDYDGKNKIVVRFMNGMTRDEMIQNMGNF